MPSHVTSTMRSMDAIVRERKEDSPAWKNYVFSLLEEAYQRDKRERKEPGENEIYLLAIELSNDYAFEWALSKRNIDNAYSFKLETLHESEEYLEAPPDYYTYEMCNAIVSYQDDGEAAVFDLSHPGQAVQCRRRRIADLAFQVQTPLARWESTTRATRVGNLYYITNCLQSIRFPVGSFFEALFMAYQLGNQKTITCWLNKALTLQNTQCQDISCETLARFNRWDHVRYYAHLLSDAQREELLYRYCISAGCNEIELEKIINHLKPIHGKSAGSWLRGAFLFVSYHLSINAIKLFFKNFTGLYDQLAVNGLPSGDDVELMKVAARNRIDHERIQYFFLAIKSLDNCPFPYDQDEKIEAVLRNVHEHDLPDLSHAVRNIEAYNKFMGYLAGGRQAAPPPYEFQSARLTTGPSSSSSVGTLHTALFTPKEPLDARAQAVEEACQLIMMTTKPNCYLPNAHELQRIGLNKLISLLAPEIKAEMKPPSLQ